MARLLPIMPIPIPTARERIAIVHNGIIENYLSIKRKLESERPPLPLRDRH